jgi:predicted NBD/HSP70 family sugar kinase
MGIHDGLILRMLRDAGPLPRAELARRSSLSPTTLTKLAARLIEYGIISETEQTTDTAPSAFIGRPPIDIALVSDSFYVLAVHIGLGTVRVALANLRAELFKETEFRFVPEHDTADSVIARLATSIRALIAKARIPRSRILGVGIAAPGPVDESHRRLLLSINVGWRDVPFADLLEAAIGLPVTVEHNVRAMALGEYRRGGWHGRSLLFVYMKTGLGAGMIIGGAPFRPGRYGVMEMGHMKVVPDGRLCACGSYGCLETVLSERSLTESVTEAGGNTADLMQAVTQIDSIRTQTVELLTTALASAVNLLNPDLIVLGGLFAAAPDRLFTDVDTELRKKVFPVLRGGIQLERSRLGFDAGLVGAAAVALDIFLYEANLSLQSKRIPAPTD